jgi:GNAT superfamily N-acetyltransferase
LDRAGIELRRECVAHRDAVWCLSGYFAEIDRRFVTGFAPEAGGAAEDTGFAPPTGDFLIARRAGEPIGCGAIAFRDGFAEIKRMWVCEDARGAGIGHEILLHLEQIARDAGFSRIRLDSNRSLTEAHKLYRRSGYGEIERYNDNPYAELWFEKTLT